MGESAWNESQEREREIAAKRMADYQQTKMSVKENKPVDDNIARCPKCGSVSLSADKKGFGIGKAVVGGLTIGLIGLAAGNIGAKKVRVTCLNCGKQFWAGRG